MHPQPDQLTELDHGSRLIDMTAPPTETRQICTPSPASSLLPEILAIIFEMTVACYNSRYEVTGNEARLNRFSSAGDREIYWKGRRQAAWNEQLESSQTFRSASQVDNFWRRSALDCKCIWGMILDIDFNSDEWVLELVRRSGTAPLVVRSIYCPGYSPARFQTSPKWAILFDQAHRLRVLQVAYNSDDYMSPLLEVLKKPMPLLEDLHLENNDHITTEEQPYDALDGPLLGGIIPSLKVMVLNRFFMIRHIDFSPFDLVRLEISIDEMLLSFSTANLLDILAEQPNLETLKFQRRLQEEIHTLPYVELREVFLPCLHSLEVDTYVGEAEGIWGSLIVPWTCNVNLHCHLDRLIVTASIDVLLRGIDRFFKSWKLDRRQWTSWAIEGWNPTNFLVTLGVGAGLADFRQSPPGKFTVHFEDSYSIPIHAADHLIRILECIKETTFGRANARLVSLNLRNFLEDFDPAAHARLSSVFSGPAFRGVQHLCIDEVGIASTLRFLLMDGQNDEPSLLFPGLQSVVLATSCEASSGPGQDLLYSFLCLREQSDMTVPEAWLRNAGRFIPLGHSRACGRPRSRSQPPMQNRHRLK